MAVFLGKAADFGNTTAKGIVAEQPFPAIECGDPHQPVMHIPATTPALRTKAVALDSSLNQPSAIIMGKLDFFALGATGNLHHAACGGLPAAWLWCWYNGAKSLVKGPAIGGGLVGNRHR